MFRRVTEPHSSPPVSVSLSAPSRADLRAALLAPADLGTMFEPAPSSTASSPSAHGWEPLATLLNGDDPGKNMTAEEVELQQSQTGPFIGEDLATRTRREYQVVADALRSCTSISLGGISSTAERINFAGPGSFAIRLDGTSQGVPVNGYLAVQQLRNALLAYFFVQVNEGSSQAASDYYNRALAKARTRLGR